MSSITNNRFGRYMIYAFGEIILVVAGILIALQINEWNNDRQLKKKELGYLEEIRENLNQDLRTIDSVMYFNRTKTKAILSSIEILGGQNEYEYLIREIASRMDTLTNFKVFVSEITAFENMISAESIDLIRNKDLRRELSAYYRNVTFESDTQEKVEDDTRRFGDDMTPFMIDKELLDKYVGVKIINEPEDYEKGSIRSKQNMANLLSMYMSIRFQNYELEVDRKQAVQLLEMIAKEIHSTR